MAKLPDTFNFGNVKDMNIDNLVLELNRMYTDLARAINLKPDLYQRNVNGVPTDGAATDTFLPIGSININTTTDKVEMLTNHSSPSAVVWTTLS